MKKQICAARALCAAVFFLAVTGCASNIEDTLQEESNTVADSSAIRAGESIGADESTSTGMGRYVEKNVLTLENWGNIQFQKATDDNLILLDDWSGGYVSKDNGESWEQEQLSCYKPIMESEESYLVREAAISTEGTAVISYYQYPDNEEEETQEKSPGAELQFLLYRCEMPRLQ